MHKVIRLPGPTPETLASKHSKTRDRLSYVEELIRRACPPFAPTRLFQTISPAPGVVLLLRFSPAIAACDNSAPVSGETVTCTPGAPNPTTTPVRATIDSTNVTIDIQPNAVLDISTSNALVAWNRSAVVNLGTVRVTGDATFAGTTVIPTSVAATTAQFQLGIVAKVSARGSVFTNAGCTTNINGEHRSVVAGDVGVRWAW